MIRFAVDFLFVRLVDIIFLEEKGQKQFDFSKFYGKAILKCDWEGRGGCGRRNVPLKSREVR